MIKAILKELYGEDSLPLLNKDDEQNFGSIESDEMRIKIGE